MEVESQFVMLQVGRHQLVVAQRRLVHLRLDDVVREDLLQSIRIADPRLLDGVGHGADGFVGRRQQRRVAQRIQRFTQTCAVINYERVMKEFDMKELKQLLFIYIFRFIYYFLIHYFLIYLFIIFLFIYLLFSYLFIY